jgi:hypothetical protein
MIPDFLSISTSWSKYSSLQAIRFGGLLKGECETNKYVFIPLTSPQATFQVTDTHTAYRANVVQEVHMRVKKG